jgi:hypothetical protein
MARGTGLREEETPPRYGAGDVLASNCDTFVPEAPGEKEPMWLDLVGVIVETVEHGAVLVVFFLFLIGAALFVVGAAWVRDPMWTPMLMLGGFLWLVACYPLLPCSVCGTWLSCSCSKD